MMDFPKYRICFVTVKCKYGVNKVDTFQVSLN